MFQECFKTRSKVDARGNRLRDALKSLSGTDSYWAVVGSGRGCGAARGPRPAQWLLDRRTERTPRRARRHNPPVRDTNTRMHYPTALHSLTTPPVLLYPPLPNLAPRARSDAAPCQPPGGYVLYAHSHHQLASHHHRWPWTSTIRIHLGCYLLHCLHGFV